MRFSTHLSLVSSSKFGRTQCFFFLVMPSRWSNQQKRWGPWYGHWEPLNDADQSCGARRVGLHTCQVLGIRGGALRSHLQKVRGSVRLRPRSLLLELDRQSKWHDQVREGQCHAKAQSEPASIRDVCVADE